MYILINLLLWTCSYGPWEHFKFSWKSWTWLVNISQISVFSKNTVFHFVFVNGKFHHVQTDDKGFYFLDIALYFLDIAPHIPTPICRNVSWEHSWKVYGNPSFVRRTKYNVYKTVIPMYFAGTFPGNVPEKWGVVNMSFFRNVPRKRSGKLSKKKCKGASKKNSKELTDDPVPLSI